MTAAPAPMPTMETLYMPVFESWHGGANEGILQLFTHKQLAAEHLVRESAQHNLSGYILIFMNHLPAGFISEYDAHAEVPNGPSMR